MVAVGVRRTLGVMTVIDDFVAHNLDYARTYPGPKPLEPQKRVAVVACMDSRLQIFPMLGLDLGEAHIIRNAGGVITDDMIRSLTISQRMLGTREIMLIHHTNCGLSTFTEDEFDEQLMASTGARVDPPDFAVAVHPAQGFGARVRGGC